MPLEEDSGGESMKCFMTSPSPIKLEELKKGFCSEAMCKQKPSQYLLLVDREGLPFNVFIPICDGHAEFYRACISDCVAEAEIGPAKQKGGV
jgi:hypothetical protein